MARHNGVIARIEFRDCAVGLIKPQTAFLLGRTVATEASSGQDWLDVAKEADRLGEASNGERPSESDARAHSHRSRNCRMVSRHQSAHRKASHYSYAFSSLAAPR